MRARRLFLVLIGLWLGACGSFGPPRTCDEIAARDLRDLMQQRRTREEIRARIAKAYKLDSGQVAVFPSGTRVGFNWDKDGVVGSLVTDNSAPVYSELIYQERPPSAGAVLKCLGVPDQSRAFYDWPPGPARHTLLVDLFFLQEGIWAQDVEASSSKEPPRLNDNTTFNEFVFVPVTSPEETEKLLLVEMFGNKLRPELKPWPGRLEDIVIGVDPAFRQ